MWKLLWLGVVRASVCWTYRYVKNMNIHRRFVMGGIQIEISKWIIELIPYTHIIDTNTSICILVSLFFQVLDFSFSQPEGGGEYPADVHLSERCRATSTQMITLFWHLTFIINNEMLQYLLILSCFRPNVYKHLASCMWNAKLTHHSSHLLQH